MAFPNSKPSMPPPGAKKPDLVVAIGAEPKKPMGNEPDGDEPDPAKGGTHKLAGAGVIREDEHCEDCSNWSQDGSCKELPGQFASGDGCLAYFTPSGEGEPDADDQGMGGDEGAESMPPPGMESMRQ